MLGVPSILFVFVVRGCMTDVWWLGWSVGRSVVLGESVGRSYNQPLVMGLADVSQGLAPLSRPTRKLVVYFDGTMVIHGYPWITMVNHG